MVSVENVDKEDHGKLEGLLDLLEKSVVKDNPLYPMVKNPWDLNAPRSYSNASRLIGIQLYNLGAYDIALEYFEKALSHSPLDSLNLFHKAKNLIALGKLERAYKIFTQAQVLCEKELEKYKGFHEMELVNFENKNDDLDLGDYERELSLINDEYFDSIKNNLQGRLMEIYEFKGLILSIMDHYSLSIKYYNKALILENTYADKDSDTLFERGYSLYRLGKFMENEKKVEAVLDFQQVLKQEGKPLLENAGFTAESYLRCPYFIETETLFYQSTRTGKDIDLLENVDG